MYVMPERSNDNRIDALEVKVDSLADRMDQRFAQVDQRFDQVDQRFAQVDQRLDWLAAELREQRKEMRTGFDSINERFERMQRLMLQSSVAAIVTLIALVGTQV